MASEASYVYILSGQKSIKNGQFWRFWRFFRKPEACGQTVLSDRSLLKGQKLVENAKLQIFKLSRLFESFSNSVITFARKFSYDVVINILLQFGFSAFGFRYQRSMNCHLSDGPKATITIRRLTIIGGIDGAFFRLFSGFFRTF